MIQNISKLNSNAVAIFFPCTKRWHIKKDQIHYHKTYAYVRYAKGNKKRHKQEDRERERGKSEREIEEKEKSRGSS